jgi:peptidoglycan/LPS O-acetylase OafA/YrhL
MHGPTGRIAGALALVVAVYLAGTTSFCVGAIGFLTFMWLFAMASAGLLVQACYGRSRPNRVFTVPALRVIGNLSYSFYLLHGIALGAIFTAFAKLGWLVAIRNESVIFTCAPVAARFVITFVGACALYALAERPYFRSKGLVAPAGGN